VTWSHLVSPWSDCTPKANDMTASIATAPGAAHAGILAIAGYRPSRVVTNEEICERIDSSDEWIRTRSGIIERRFAEPHETVQMMSVEASRKALERADVAPGQLDCIIVATVSHLMQTPAVATLIADELGAGPAPAFDISAACAGFSHGVGLAADMIRAGSAKYVLVIGVERLSDITDPTDRGTAFIFADGAGAAVVGPASQHEGPGIGPITAGSAGDLVDTIVIADRNSFIRQEGQEVYRWAITTIAPVALRALELAGLAPVDVDVLVPHQANLRIIEAIAKRLRSAGAREDMVVADDIIHSGNTSSASIPLALDHMRAEGRVRSGDLALLVGFGAGLSYAGQAVVLP
jgi:3-oxoacyl-[acyl-carrier-protein] synthase III